MFIILLPAGTVLYNHVKISFPRRW